MHLNELKALHVSEVLKQAEELEIENTGRMRKQELMFAIIKKRARTGEQIIADGVLEILPDGFGFLRSPDTSYTASTDDIYISPSQVRRFNLHTGDMIEGEVRTPKDGERYFALVKVNTINFEDPEAVRHKVNFDNLTPLYPNERLIMEIQDPTLRDRSGRVIDILNLGAQTAGRSAFDWNPAAAAGAVEGEKYTFRITATTGTAQVGAEPLMLDRVRAVSVDGDRLMLETENSGRVAYGDVRAFN